jgi:hypothetical protein
MAYHNPASSPAASIFLVLGFLFPDHHGIWDRLQDGFTAAGSLVIPDNTGL